MDKAKLLTIGDLAKLSGANIKSLRYYGEIGILPPAYVDSATGYRYYSLAQIHVVDAIQLCIELDIPLREFSRFLDEDKKQIHYARLLDKGREMARERIRSIRRRLDFLDQAEQELEWSQKLQQSGEAQTFLLEEKTYLLLPYSGKLNTVEYYKGIGQLFQRAKGASLQPRFEFGQLLLWEKNGSRQYIFLEIDAASAPSEGLPDLIVLPGGEYRFLNLRESSIEKAPALFASLFASPYPKTVVEVEAIAEISDLSEPCFQLRCSLPETGFPVIEQGRL